MRVSSVLAAALALGACGNAGGPSLVELKEIGPASVETGDRLHIAGAGFPEGRSARVRLHGDLYRAGEPPLLGVEASAEAELASPHSLELPVTPLLVTRLCGDPDPRHTTFRGDVEVTFLPRTSSGSEVKGRLDGVVVDVMPDRAGASPALKSQGERFAHFVGATLVLSEEGLSVTSTAPRSRAARAGLVSGDTLTELDGSVIRGVSDFVPPPNARISSLTVLRSGEPVSLRLDSTGFRYSSPDTLSRAIALVGFALFCFALFCSPLGGALAFLERRLVERLREATSGTGSQSSQPLVLGALQALTRQLPTTFVPYFGLVSVSALFTLMALGKGVVASEIDLLVLPAITALTLLLTSVFTGRNRDRWSLFAGVKRAFFLLALLLPLPLLIATAGLDNGSFRAEDLVLAQGAWPWEWGMFRSLSLFVAGAINILALVPLARHSSALLPEGKPRAGERFLDAAHAIHQLVSVGALSVVLFGGWQLAGSDASLRLSVLGALLLLVKSWGLLLFATLLRWALGRVDVGMLGSAAYAWLFLPSALSVVLPFALRHAVRSHVFATLDASMGPLLFAAGLVTLGWLAARVREGLKTPKSELGIQPWV